MKPSINALTSYIIFLGFSHLFILIKKIPMLHRYFACYYCEFHCKFAEMEGQVLVQGPTPFVEQYQFGVVCHYEEVSATTLSLLNCNTHDHVCHYEQASRIRNGAKGNGSDYAASHVTFIIHAFGWCQSLRHSTLQSRASLLDKVGMFFNAYKTLTHTYFQAIYIQFWALEYPAYSLVLYCCSKYSTSPTDPFFLSPNICQADPFPPTSTSYSCKKRALKRKLMESVRNLGLQNSLDHLSSQVLTHSSGWHISHSSLCITARRTAGPCFGQA